MEWPICIAFCVFTICAFVEGTDIVATYMKHKLECGRQKLEKESLDLRRIEAARLLIEARK